MSRPGEACILSNPPGPLDIPAHQLNPGRSWRYLPDDAIWRTLWGASYQLSAVSYQFPGVVLGLGGPLPSGPTAARSVLTQGQQQEAELAARN